MDFINKISLTSNTDTAHRIYFLRDTTVQSVSLAELDRQATLVASRLHALGLGKGDRIGVLARNGLEWTALDIGILKLGAITVGLDLGRFQADTALQRYGLQRLFVDHETNDDPRIIRMDHVREWASGEQNLSQSFPLHQGYEADAACAIKFTSGSTSEAKGLEATVGSINDSLSSVQEMFRHVDGDNLLIFQRQSLLQQRYWIYSAMVNGHDITVAAPDYVLPVAQAVHPTVIMGIPGFFDDVRRKLESTADYQADDRMGRYQLIQSIFGGRIRYLWTGSAPASRATLDFYNDCGVPLYQGYGLNETCIVAKNYPGANRIGSVGKVLPNKTARFDSQGMLIVGSRHPVATQYLWCAPGDNELMFLPSGEVKTQDMGYFDDDNYLYILGRFDDLIALSCGRKVIVYPIEERLKQHSDIHECVLYGNGKPFLTALVSPVTGAVDRAGIVNHINAINADLMREQQIQIGGLVIGQEQFSFENGMLTSEFKPKRKEIHHRLMSEIDAIYAPGGRSILSESVSKR